MSSELIGRCGGQRPGHHASIRGSSSALCHIGASSLSSHRFLCDWSLSKGGDGRSGSSVALRCKPTFGDGVGDGWSGSTGNDSSGASAAGTGDGCCSSESSGIVYAWHAAESSIPQQPRRTRAATATGSEQTFQTGTSGGALSSTNDLARAISQFDEASVLALLKQARACQARIKFRVRARVRCANAAPSLRSTRPRSLPPPRRGTRPTRSTRRSTL
eukprot:scaffold64356_cov57-Phaeocystis_antarctica.AAC.3